MQTYSINCQSPWCKSTTTTTIISQDTARRIRPGDFNGDTLAPRFGNNSTASLKGDRRRELFASWAMAPMVIGGMGADIAWMPLDDLTTILWSLRAGFTTLAVGGLIAYFLRSIQKTKLPTIFIKSQRASTSIKMASHSCHQLLQETAWPTWRSSSRTSGIARSLAAC